MVQRDRFESRISLDSLLLVITLCSTTDKDGLEPRGRTAIWWGLVCDSCTLAYVPKYAMAKLKIQFVAADKPTP
jgi:choline-glycine betaine transporter